MFSRTKTYKQLSNCINHEYSTETEWNSKVLRVKVVRKQRDSHLLKPPPTRTEYSYWSHVSSVIRTHRSIGVHLVMWMCRKWKGSYHFWIAKYNHNIQPNRLHFDFQQRCLNDIRCQMSGRPQINFLNFCFKRYNAPISFYSCLRIVSFVISFFRHLAVLLIRCNQSVPHLHQFLVLHNMRMYKKNQTDR